MPSRQKLNIACRPSHGNVVQFEEVEALLYIPSAMYLTTLRSGILSQSFLLFLDDVLGSSNSRWRADSLASLHDDSFANPSLSLC